MENNEPRYFSNSVIVGYDPKQKAYLTVRESELEEYLAKRGPLDKSTFTKFPNPYERAE